MGTGWWGQGDGDGMGTWVGKRRLDGDRTGTMGWAQGGGRHWGMGVAQGDGDRMGTGRWGQGVHEGGHRDGDREMGMGGYKRVGTGR